MDASATNLQHNKHYIIYVITDIYMYDLVTSIIYMYAFFLLTLYSHTP